MINYRPHRDGLKESIDESITFNSFREMHNTLDFDSIELYSFDTRVDQQLFIVKKDSYPLGFIFI